MARRSRAEMSEANRAAVLEAARAHFEERGFHGASLDAIAEAAGFSKGAVYSRFASKDELFLAVLGDHIERRAAVTEDRLAALDGAIELTTLAELSIRASVATVAWQAALLEFRAHAWRDDDLNARYRALHRRTVESIAGFMGEVYRRRGALPPIPVEQMAIAGLAIGTGVVTEHMADPDADVDALIDAAVAGLAVQLRHEVPR